MTNDANPDWGIGAEREVVHILVQGRALCPIDGVFPRDWPEGHRWVRVSERALATCPVCLEKVAACGA